MGDYIVLTLKVQDMGIPDISFFPMRTQHRGCAISTLEVFKTWQDQVLNNLVWFQSCSALNRRWNRDRFPKVLSSLSYLVIPWNLMKTKQNKTTYEEEWYGLLHLHLHFVIQLWEKRDGRNCKSESKKRIRSRTGRHTWDHRSFILPMEKLKCFTAESANHVSEYSKSLKSWVFADSLGSAKMSSYQLPLSSGLSSALTEI